MDSSDLHPHITPEGTAAFLAGKWVEGIGEVFAKRLVEAFGTDAVRILEHHPERALTVKGLGEAKVKQAADSLACLPYPADLLQFLYSCGISDIYIERILAKYKADTLQVITTDPYTMVEDVWQLSFFTADKIGRHIGIKVDDPGRIQGALVTAVKQYAENGHLFAYPNDAITSAASITGLSPTEIEPQIEPLVESGRVVQSRGGLYLPVFYKAEKEGAARLAQLVAEDVQPIEEWDLPTHDRENHPYSPSQRSAITKLVNAPVAVLTGGPGTGKTTVLKGVLDVLGRQQKKVVLCAPTGRAAKRMTTLTGLEASTIHRLLGYRQGEGYNNRKIDADVLIVDEGSMMEQVLFNHLLQALKPHTRIIMVGDVDQLPAIGAGDVLRDLIESGAVPVARLNDNFRQKAGSLIAAGASAINSGQLPASNHASDFMIIPQNGTAKIHARIIRMVTHELPASRGIHPADITVVTPQQIGPLGARQLNADLQAAINPEGPQVVRGGTIFRVGDPVMQKVNSPLRNVYNGEVGRITAADPDAGSITVSFPDGRTSTYARSELAELVLAYATTVHKLQGSEVRYMIFPLSMTHRPMLYRNLLYTGVSRASDLCVLVGEEEALRYAIANNPANTRNSNFRFRLTQESQIQR